MWRPFAHLFTLILYYSGCGLAIFVISSSFFFSNGSAALELASSAGNNPALRYYEPVFYNPSEFISQHRRKKREIRNSESLRLNIASPSRDFHLNLNTDDSVFHPEIEIENSEGPVDYDTGRVLVGHLDDEPGSLAHGVLSEDGYFDGTIYSATGSEYYLEPRKRYSSINANASQGIFYEKDAIVWPDEPPVCASHELHLRRKEERFSGHANFYHDHDPHASSLIENRPQNHTIRHTAYPKSVTLSLASHSTKSHSHTNRRSKRYIIDPRKRTCMLYLQADHLFYRHFGSEEAAINMMARHIQRVNEIYKTTDFDGDGVPDDISFMIKRIKVHTKNHTLDPTYRYNGDFQVIKFLELFSEGDYDQFCLAYMFTFRDFEGGTLGLAWTGDLKNAGGVCERKGHFRGGLKSLNTGIITLLNYGKVVLPAVSFVTLAHEIGHNFGSPHDPESDKDCTPGGREGNYIMYARATAGDQRNNNRFSPCSLRSIIPVLNSKARGTHGCFVEPQQAICGNREVEEGEECDCGWEEDCAERCCWPMKIRPARGEKPCTLKEFKDCSPSQGPCCTANCTLKIGEKCRDDNGCRHSAFCDGYMPTCPSSIHKPNRTICHEEQSVCFMGECTGSICLAYGLESCQCGNSEPWESASKYCELCCKLPGEGQPCLSSYQWNEPPFDVPNLYSKPGSPCKNYTGYCDAYHVCRMVDPSGPLATLRNLLLADEGLTAIADWIDTHWYAVLCFFVLLILMMVLTIKLCGKRAKQRLRKITVMHSNVEAVQVERSYWDEQGEHVVHPMAVRKKIPIRKKVREKKRSKSRSGSSKNKGDRPVKAVTGTLFRRKGRGERSKVNGNFTNPSASKTDNLSPGDPSNLNGDLQSPTSPTQSFNLVNLHHAPNSVGEGISAAGYPPLPPPGNAPLYPNYMIAAETSNGMIGAGGGKQYNHSSCNNNIPSPGSSSSGGFRTTAASPRSPITPGDNINDPLCAALVNHEPKTVILPAAGVRRKRYKSLEKKDKKSKHSKTQRTSLKRAQGNDGHSRQHNHLNHHHDSNGIKKRKSIKAVTKDHSAHQTSSASVPSGSNEAQGKQKKRIQVVFSPPFSLKVVQMVKGGLEGNNSKGAKSRSKSANGSNKNGAAQNASTGKNGNSGGNNNNKVNNGSEHSPRGSGNSINNVANKKSESEVPKSGAVAGAAVVASVKNDLSTGNHFHHHHSKSNGANDTNLLSNGQSKSSDNLASPQKGFNKSINQNRQENKSAKVALSKSKSSGSLIGANQNVKGDSKRDSDKNIENLTKPNSLKVVDDAILDIQKKSGNADESRVSGGVEGGNSNKNKKDNNNKVSNNNTNHSSSSNHHHNIKSKVKSSGSFLQRRKQNLKAGRSGEKSELRVLIPPASQEEDEFNSPITPMS